MANSFITIGNELHGNLVTRKMTDEEQEAYEKSFADENNARKARDVAQTAKQAARQAVLDRLGLTEQEAQLLLGS